MPVVFLPTLRARAAELRMGGTIDGAGHAPTGALLRAHELTEGEDADYTALAYAGVAALQLPEEGLRLVLACDVSPGQLHDESDDFGAVSVTAVAWSQVTALFADEAGAAETVAQARDLARGRPLAEVVDDSAVESLVDSADLLWFVPDELGFLPG